MGIKDYKEKYAENNKGRFDKMVESKLDSSNVVDNDTVEFNISAIIEKTSEPRKTFSYTLKPSFDEKLKKLAKEKGYSNKSRFLSAIIEGLPDPKN